MRTTDYMECCDMCEPEDEELVRAVANVDPCYDDITG